MKRYKIEVVGSKHPSNQVDADYVSKSRGSYYFRESMEYGPDKTIAIFPVSITIIHSITSLSEKEDNGIFTDEDDDDEF